LELIEHASEHITNEILNDQLRLFHDLVDNDEDFTLYVLNAFMTKVVSDDLSDPYVKICAWILGQIGSKTCNFLKRSEQPQKGRGMSLDSALTGRTENRVQLNRLGP
jgi:hypothetical protein